MSKSDQHHILPSHKDKLGFTFAYIHELLEEGNTKKAKELLAKMHQADFADFLDNASYKTNEQAIALLGNIFKPETLVWINLSTKRSIETIVDVKTLANWIDALDTEDAIEVLEDFSTKTKDNILLVLSKEKRKQILEGFTYGEHTSGRVMETDFVSFADNWTVEEAINSIREQNLQHDFHAAIILDSKKKPVGNILLCTLLKHAPDTPIKSLMNEDFKIVTTHTDLDQLSYIFKQYALTIVPVVNKSGKLVGTVSIDNMLYIVEQQAEEDFMHLGGVNVQDTSYSLFYTVRHRFAWLFMNLITAGITAMVIHQFSSTIAQIITLASIMPVVASMGGNAGTQAMTVTVRAIASQDISAANYKRAIIKELLVCGANGVILSIIGGLMTYILFNKLDLSIIFASAVAINFFIAGLFGSAIPIILDHFDIDPAPASGVLLTTLTDSFGFFTFLILAYVFLI
jgi:magnesium transporter